MVRSACCCATRKQSCLDPRRDQRQPCRTDWPQALQLDDPNDGAVIVDTASAARSVKTSEREQLAKYKVPCCFGIEGFGGRRAKREQNKHYYRTTARSY